MSRTYVTASVTGEIVGVATGDELIVSAPSWLQGTSHEIMATYMIEDPDGEPRLVERPRLFEADMVYVAAGERFEHKVPPRTEISFDRPDLPLTGRGKVQRFDENLTEGLFEFLSELPGSFVIRFRECFPYQEQTVTILVGEPE